MKIANNSQAMTAAPAISPFCDSKAYPTLVEARKTSAMTPVIFVARVAEWVCLSLLKAVKPVRTTRKTEYACQRAIWEGR